MEQVVLCEPASGSCIEFTVFRQSGNFERQTVFYSRSEALSSANKLFRRAKEDSVRIWKNEETILDIRRPYGSLKGTREGRKIWGVDIRIVLEE